MKIFTLIFLMFISVPLFSQSIEPLPQKMDYLKAYNSIKVGMKVDANRFIEGFDAPFVIVSQDFDGSIKLVSRQVTVVYYDEQYRTPIERNIQVYVIVRNSRIYSKKLEIMEISKKY